MTSLLVNTDNVYNNLLNHFEDTNNIDNLEQYLQQLQPYVRDLRQTYRANFVEANYLDYKTQAAYFIAYYPHYVQMTYKVLEDLARNNITLPFKGLDRLQACFFGAEPAPEFLGWINYLKTYHNNINNVMGHTYDIAAAGWTKTRRTTVSLVSRSWLDRRFVLNASNLNLCQKNSLHSLRPVIKNCCLFLAQNCLNEIAASPENFIENVDFLVDTMPSNSIFIMADLNYDSMIGLMNQTEVSLRNKSQAIIARSHTTGTLRFSSSIPIPAIILKIFLIAMIYLFHETG